jgi:hypothetical protein
MAPSINPTNWVGIPRPALRELEYRHGRPAHKDGAMELSGKVVVLPMEWEGGEALAVALGGRGATVVLVGGDGEALGRLAARMGGRPAVFVSDGSAGSVEALGDFVAELFRPPS